MRMLPGHLGLIASLGAALVVVAIAVAVGLALASLSQDPWFVAAGYIAFFLFLYHGASIKVNK